ncbi:MAG: ASKHA domain-containing protein, partial [Planctomycetota bacterium]
MAEDTLKVTFQPSGISVEAKAGETLLEAARRRKVYVNSPCGGKGNCGKCRLRVLSGPVEREISHLLEPSDAEAGWALACRTKPRGAVEVEIPPETRGLPGQIAAARREDPSAVAPFDPGPLPYLEPDPVFHQSPLSTRVFCPDLDRLRRWFRSKWDFDRIYSRLALVRELPKTLREADFQVTVTLGKRGGRSAEILAVSPGDVSARNFGAALDLGTTTLVLHVVDLESGKTVGAAASLNSQTRFGDDVITRIFHASQPGGLEALNAAVLEDINRLAGEACAEAGIPLQDVTSMQVSGNTTMTQLFLSIDPAQIRKDPYVATANFFPQVSARELGVAIHPAAMVSAAPAVASYVGGDIVSGIVAVGMAERTETALFVDLGTNGEMVLGNRDWLACVACSVGPAFEGSGIRCGTRAAPGAIQEVEVSDGGETVVFSTIGDTEVTGICGSGLIDLIASLRTQSVLDRSAKIQEGAAPSRVRRGSEGLEYVVSAGSGREIFVTQPDLDNLLRSKAAVYAACALLVKRMGITFQDVERIFIAGGFGNYLDVDKAIRIGLLPDLPRERFTFVGNTSLIGAKMGL